MDNIQGEPANDTEAQPLDFLSIMNQQIQLKSFKGQGEDPHKKWWMYFERWTAFLNMDKPMAAMDLPFHLKGIAKSLYDSLLDATKLSLDLLKAAFITRFSVTSTEDISVLTMCQKQDEKTETYYSRFVDNSHGKALPENRQVSILMRGLKPSLLSLVMPKNPKT